MMTRRAYVFLAALAAAGCDPTMSLDTAGLHLVVGQTGRIQVIEGGDEAPIVLDTLSLIDTGGRAYDAKALSAKAPSGKLIELVVPTGIAPGKGDLKVSTSDGYSFEGTVQITRLAAMRDLAGKVWMLALPEVGTMNQYLDISPGTKGMGKGAGAVAISPDGKLLASSARGIWRVYLAWTGDHPMKKNPVQLPRQVEAITVTSTHHTLAATDKGTFYIEPPKSRTATLSLGKSGLATGTTLALASARNAKVAVALSSTGSKNPSYKLYRLDLSGATPAVKSQDDINWAVQAGNSFSMALSHDGSAALVTNMAGHRVNLMLKGSKNTTALPSSQRGPVSVAAGSGGVFYVLNQGSKNISVVKTSGSTIKFEKVIKLNMTALSGKPMQLSMSDNGELTVLAERDVLLVYPKTGKVHTIRFANLFSNKTKGEVGGSIAIQP